MRGSYDPVTRTIDLSADATDYTRYHELAHKELHDRHPIVFNILLYSRCIRFVGYVATLLLELDAHLRAKMVMQRLGLLNDEACKEGRNNLKSYATLKETQ